MKTFQTAWLGSYELSCGKSDGNKRCVCVQVGPLPSTAGLESGPFVGNYSDGLMAALLASCAAKVKPPLEGFGRDLQPYFKPERAEPPKAKAQADSKKKGRKGAGENSPPASTGARTPVGDRAQASPRRPSKRPKSTPKATAPTRYYALPAGASSPDSLF